MVRLGDLGCAKLMKSGMARTQIGTPYYMSPEIWSHRPYDAKSDIWALGAMLYEMCMLNPPFLANDMNSLARKVKTAPTPRISKHYSSELHAIINAMLSKNPASRPSVADILSDPSVTSRLHLVPSSDKTKWTDERESALLATIKVPKYMGYGAARGIKLPDAAYPAEAMPADAAAVRPGTSPAKPVVQRAPAAVPARPSTAQSSYQPKPVVSHGLRKVPSGGALPSRSKPSLGGVHAPAPSSRYARAPSSRGGAGRMAAVAAAHGPSSRAPSSRAPSSRAVSSRAGAGGVVASRRPTAAAARRYGAAAAAAGGRKAPVSAAYRAPSYRGGVPSSRPW